MTAQQPAVKKYIVKLTAEERTRLDVLIQKGKAAARQLLKARILLKADASTACEAWSDSRIAAALDTSIDTIARMDAALAHRNNNHTKADWQFTTASARVKLKRLYPAL